MPGVPVEHTFLKVPRAPLWFGVRPSLSLLSVHSLLLLLFLAGCGGGAPVVADPPRIKAALEAESDGAKRYERGDYAVAAHRFEEAARLFGSIDDRAGVGRNRLHWARADLALGRSEAVLRTLAALGHDKENTQPLEMLLLKAQAQLDLARLDAASQDLASATDLCGNTCALLPSLHLLQSRAALAALRADDALSHAEAALGLLNGRDEPLETANAWRLIAAARLARGDASTALAAAQSALNIDRRLALPGKIASDWLLIGDIHKKVGAGDTAIAAYQRALGIAIAARLDEAEKTARQALTSSGE